MGFYVSFSYGPMVNRVSETFDSDNHPINNTWPPVELYSAKTYTNMGLLTLTRLAMIMIRLRVHDRKLAQ